MNRLIFLFGLFIKELMTKISVENSQRKSTKILLLRGYCIQNFHLGRNIVGYTVGNLVLQRRASWAVKRYFRTYIRQYTSPIENFEYGYPHSNTLLQFCLKLERCKPHNAACPATKRDLINDVKMFPTVYHRIYCRNCLTLSNPKSRYKASALESYLPDSEERTDRASANSSLDTVRVSMEHERTGIPSAVEDKDNNFNPFCNDGFFLLA